MTKPNDDLEAVRQIVTTLEGFEAGERERIMRWAGEKLGMSVESLNPVMPQRILAVVGDSGSVTATALSAPPTSDLKSFIQSKSPRKDTELAATIAFFYRFVAPEAEKKDDIGSDDFIDACRKAERRRPARPAQTLINAYKSGVVDKAGPSRYRLNSVGENLVAMVLPGDASNSLPSNAVRRIKRPGRKPAVRSAKKTKSGSSRPNK